MRLTHVTRTVLLNSETWVINSELSTTQDFFWRSPRESLSQNKIPNLVNTLGLLQLKKLQSWLSALFYAHSKSFSWRAMINENCLFSSTWQGCLLQPSKNVFITYCHVKNLSKLKNCAFLQQISRILSCNDFDSLCEVRRNDTQNLNCVPIHTVTNLRKILCEKIVALLRYRSSLVGSNSRIRNESWKNEPPCWDQIH